VVQSIAAPAEYVAELELKVENHIRQRVLGGDFMRELSAGTLPLETFQGWSRNWYTFALEINTAVSCLYHRFGWLWRKYSDFEDFITERVSEEAGQPGAGGHIRTFETLGAAIGLTREDLTTQQLLPGCRAGIDYYVRVIFEATPHEIGAVLLNERAHGSIVFGEIYEALKRPPYNLTEDALLYFSLHSIADMEHGDENRQFFTRLLEREPVQERPGWGMEYTTMVWAEMFARFFEETYAAYRPRA
jgi:pyrroloquinoline quinone (PQQ) biosynthesis protein C